ncbi:MAG TPA: hypothetical protein PLN65_03665 [Enterococcus sp.]|nr:hypothetical protein [Enterococcus sp.]
MENYCIHPQRLLPQWKALVENRSHLDEGEKRSAKILFSALKEMDKEDIQFLSAKYYQSEQGGREHPLREGYYKTYKPISDQKMAIVSGITSDKYREKRLKVENRLRAKLLEVNHKLLAIDRENLEVYVLKLGDLYLKDYEISSLGYISKEFTFTQESEKATKFDKSSKVGMELIRTMHLTKENPSKTEWFPILWIDMEQIVN